MPGTVLVREVLRRASVLLLDISPQYVKHPELHLVDYLNDAQLALAKYMPIVGGRRDAFRLAAGQSRQCLESVATTHLKAGPSGAAPSAAVRGISLISVLRNMGADGATPGRAVRMVGRDHLDAVDMDWAAGEKATAVRSCVYDPLAPLYFDVSPVPHATTQVWVEIAWNAQPVRIPNGGAAGAEVYASGGASTTVISVPDIYVDDLVNYIVARANLEQSEWADAAKGQAFGQLFSGSINAQVAALTGTNPNIQRLPFAPEPIGRAS